MSAKNEIKTQETSGYLVLENTDLEAILSEEMDGLSATFERIKMPSGGGVMFEIPGEEVEETESVKEFSAVILHQHAMNTYYKTDYTGGSNPPDCGSMDGHNGEGDPGGNCDCCPLNEYDSGKNGGKACKNRRRLYLLREGDMFPMIMSLPTGSLKTFTHYLMRLIPRYKHSNAVVTHFSIKKVSSNTGMPYGQVQFTVERPLTPDEMRIITGMSEQVKAISKNVAFDAETEEEINVDPETGEVIEPLQ